MKMPKKTYFVSPWPYRDLNGQYKKVTISKYQCKLIKKECKGEVNR